MESILDLKPETIINHFLEVYRKWFGAGNGNGKTALFSRGGKSTKGSKSSKKDMKCSACEKTGYRKDKCWKKHSERMPEWAKKAAAKKDAKKASFRQEKRIVMAAIKQSDGSGYDNNWYLNSFCSSHVTPQRELFVNLERLETS